ncbi:hypothetical protein ACIPLC_35930 [Kitasatospora sp. NPDC086801]|uniref:hypothetical protein n=1 Tax=Kitasatospora sp. NPDC086801 TaxID=3364066 RepID=UPI003827F2A9
MLLALEERRPHSAVAVAPAYMLRARIESTDDGSGGGTDDGRRVSLTLDPAYVGPIFAFPHGSQGSGPVRGVLSTVVPTQDRS